METGTSRNGKKVTVTKTTITNPDGSKTETVTEDIGDVGRITDHSNGGNKGASNRSKPLK